VEIRGDQARLLAVAERAKYLFGTTRSVPPQQTIAKKKQMTLFPDLEESAEARDWGDIGTPTVGKTTLDRVHQAMLLFSAGAPDALTRFLVEEGVGKSPQFWKLAQSLSALYPSASDEKRWVDGVLGRKRGSGY
jgi:putative DNA methylase